MQNINWISFEKFIGEEIPSCVKRILSIMCGYDSFFSIKEIKQSHIEDMEKFITANKIEAIRTLNCCHSDHYKTLCIFRFLPGHAAIISALPKYIEHFNKTGSSDFEYSGRYSYIFEEMIRTAESNLFKDPNHATYSDAIRYFATYIFLLSGRSCYEMLRSNLPLPSTKTICK